VGLGGEARLRQGLEEFAVVEAWLSHWHSDLWR
jgi:hypothetical protein